MIYWGSNLDHVIICMFVSKSTTSQDSNSQSGKTTWEWWDSFFHTCENVFESKTFSFFNLSCKFKAKIVKKLYRGKWCLFPRVCTM